MLLYKFGACPPTAPKKPIATTKQNSQFPQNGGEKEEISAPAPFFDMNVITIKFLAIYMPVKRCSLKS